MSLHNLRARQPEIIRCVQTDARYTEELANDFRELLRLINTSHRIKYNHWCSIFAQLVYHGFIALNGIQTLGEEYVGIVQIDSNYRQIPAKWLQLLAIILEFSGETIYMNILRKTIEYIERNDELLPERKKKLKLFLNRMRSSPMFIEALHKTYFYLHSGHYQISKRITGINYMLIRRWLQSQRSLFGYKILGLITFIQVIMRLVTTTRDMWLTRKQHETSNLSRCYQYDNDKNDQENPHLPRCILCLDIRTHTSLTSCGHLFCWFCILQWLDERNECPICKESIKKSQIIQLQNYS